MKALGVKERISLIDNILSKKYTINGKIYDFDSVTFRDIIERDYCNTQKIIEMISGKVKKLGSGSYGIVYEVICNNEICTRNNSLVFKQTRFKSDEKIKPEDPRSVENAEVKTLQVLQQFLLGGQTPHLPLLIADFTCTYAGVTSRYIVTERANTTLRDYLDRQPKSSLLVKVILFQLIWTLAVIQDRYPDFRHNDLKADNILIIPAPKIGYRKYTWIRDSEKIFYVPNVGVDIILWDFGLTSIGKVVSNQQSIKFMSKNREVGVVKNQYVDLVKMLFWIRFLNFKHWFPITVKKYRDDPRRNQIKGFIERAMPIEYTDYPLWNEYHTTIVDYEYTTPKKLLSDPFFGEFLKEQSVMEEYSTWDISIKGEETSDFKFIKFDPLVTKIPSASCDVIDKYILPKNINNIRYNWNKCTLMGDTDIISVESIDKVFETGFEDVLYMLSGKKILKVEILKLAFRIRDAILHELYIGNIELYNNLVNVSLILAAYFITGIFWRDLNEYISVNYLEQIFYILQSTYIDIFLKYRWTLAEILKVIPDYTKLLGAVMWYKV